jgi:predicted nucleotide-binding protein
MSIQQPPFTYAGLDYKLQERLGSALKDICDISKEDVLTCDTGCLTELVRQFAIAPPILRTDQIVADEEIIESVDIVCHRKTGHTNYSFLVPVEREAEWLEEVRDQRTTIDDYPLAFLDRKRAGIEIRLMISPEDADGTLKQKLDQRTTLVAKYSDSVAARIVEFNKDLATKMVAELNKRKQAIEKAKRELENTGIPRVHNPEHAVTAIKVARLLKNLGADMTGRYPPTNETQIRSFIVHGHDDLSLFQLKDYLQNTLGLGKPTVLREMPGGGKTLIEKFERNASEVQLVFVLLTPDDTVIDPARSNDLRRRARQNVIFELGFFLGKLGRTSGRILLLHKGPVEIPSDIAGVEYIDISNGILSAGENIRRELRAAGMVK